MLKPGRWVFCALLLVPASTSTFTVCSIANATSLSTGDPLAIIDDLHAYESLRSTVRDRLTTQPTCGLSDSQAGLFQRGYRDYDDLTHDEAHTLFTGVDAENRFGPSRFSVISNTVLIHPTGLFFANSEPHHPRDRARGWINSETKSRPRIANRPQTTHAHYDHTPDVLLAISEPATVIIMGAGLLAIGIIYRLRKTLS